MITQEPIKDVIRLYRKSYPDNEQLPEAHRAACRAVQSLCNILSDIVAQIENITQSNVNR